TSSTWRAHSDSSFVSDKRFYCRPSAVGKFQSERLSTDTEETPRRPPKSNQQESVHTPQDRRRVPRKGVQRRRVHERDTRGRRGVRERKAFGELRQGRDKRRQRP